MKNAILVPGMPEKKEYYSPDCPTNSNSGWFPWLSKQLQIRDIFTVALEIPDAYYPEYTVWKRELERFDITRDTILVGHSCGGGFLLRWLSENPDIYISKLILVAPWMGLGFGQKFDPEFFKFDIDPKLIDRSEALTMFSSNDDFPAIQESVKILETRVPGMKHIKLENRGHFTFEEMNTVEFPELLQEILI